MRPLPTSLGGAFRLISFGEDAGLSDFGVPAGLGGVLEGPGFSLVLSPTLKDFALGFPKKSKYKQVQCTVERLQYGHQGQKRVYHGDV